MNEKEHRLDDRGLMNWIRNWGVVTLLILVASHQFYRVHFEGLSSWRGGGFGMYGGYHPKHHDLWWVNEATGESRRYTKKNGQATEDEYRGLVRPVLTYVNQRALERIHAALPEQKREQVSLSVWQLDFEPETGELSRRELISVEREGSK